MKTIFAVAVFSCLTAIFGLAQNQDCVRRMTEFEASSCPSVLPSDGNVNNNYFCNTCANTLIRIYQDCYGTGGYGVDYIKQCKSIMHALHVLYNISIRPECLQNMQCMHNSYRNSH